MSWLRSFLLSVMADGEVLRRSGKSLVGAEVSTLTPAGHWLPGTTASYDLGVTGTRWRDLWLSRNATIGGTLGVTGAATLSSTLAVTSNATVGGTLGVTGAATLSSTLGVTGAATLSSTLALGGVQTTTLDDATTDAVSRGHTLSHTTTGTAAAGIGAGMLFRAESGAGTLRSAGAVDAIHTDVTDGAEVSALVLGAGIAGSILEVARFAAVASAVNGLSATASATGQPVTLAARGSDTDVAIGLKGKGAGMAFLQPASSDNILGVSPTGIIVDHGSDTTASPTVSRNSGVVRVQNAATTVTVTNTLCTENSLIFAAIRAATTNAVHILRIVPGNGSFVITLSGDPGASHADIAFFMVQPDV